MPDADEMPSTSPLLFGTLVKLSTNSAERGYIYAEGCGTARRGARGTAPLQTVFDVTHRRFSNPNCSLMLDRHHDRHHCPDFSFGGDQAREMFGR